MRRFAIGIAAVASFSLFVPAVGHAIPFKLSLVQAYAPCVAPNATHPEPPSSTACAPAVPLSAFRLPSGPSTIRLSTNAGALRVSVSLRGVLGPDSSPYGGSLTARVVVRLTDDHCSAGRCTVEDAEFFSTLLCAAGRCNVNAVPAPLARDRVALEVVRVEILDDAGDVLAVPGLAP